MSSLAFLQFLLSSLKLFLPLFHSGSRSSKTFKPKKNIPEGSHQYELLKHAEATLGSGNLRMAVMLPEGEDLNEWVAVNSKSLDLFLWEVDSKCGLVMNKDTCMLGFSSCTTMCCTAIKRAKDGII